MLRNIIHTDYKDCWILGERKYTSPANQRNITSYGSVSIDQLPDGEELIFLAVILHL